MRKEGKREVVEGGFKLNVGLMIVLVKFRRRFGGGMVF